MEKAFDTGKYMRIQSYSTEIYEQIIKKEADALGLTKPEADVLLFFANNPEFHSAVDAARFRGVSKAYVSKALVRLADKGLITARTDENDRRFQKIFVTDKADPIVYKLQDAQQQFAQVITRYLSEEKKKTLIGLVPILLENVTRVYEDEIGSDV